MPNQLDRDIQAKIAEHIAPRNLRLLFAIESGSRAWGFASPASAYDVRFVFAKRKNDYIAISEGITDLQVKSGPYDFAGLDLKKTLVLAAKSNPALIEWLNSPIVYHDPLWFRGALRGLLQEGYSPRRLGYHYLNFSKSKPGQNSLKAYLYAVRPLLSISWMLQKGYYDFPPISIQDLLEQELPIGIADEINTVMRLRSEGAAKKYSSVPLDSFIISARETFESLLQDLPDRRPPIGSLNALFRQTIDRVDEYLFTDKKI